MNLAALAVFWLLLLFCPVARADTHHVYVNGTVTDLSTDSITVGSQRFGRTAATKVVIQYRHGDSLYERGGGQHDIRNGEMVTVKVVGNMAVDVILERWRE